MKVSQLLSGASIMLLGLWSLPAAATQSLDVFVEGSRKQAFDNRDAVAQTQVRDAELEQARSKLWPSFSARGVYSRQEETSVPFGGQEVVITPQDQFDAYLQLDVPIVDIGNYRRYKAAEYQLEAAKQQRPVSELDVTKGVVRAYYQYRAASALLNSAQLSVQVAEANTANVAVRKELGAATDLDYERAVSAAERARQDVADAELQLKLSARTLETLSGVTPAAPTALPVDDLAPEAPFTHWQQRAQNVPALKAAAVRLQAADTARRASEAAWFPTLTASAQERFTNAGGFSGRSQNYLLQATLAWRVDHALIAGNSVAQAQLANTQVQNERLQRSVEDAVFEAYHRVEAGLARCRSTRAQQKAAERAAALATDRYTIGAATQLDVTLAQREAFLASAASIQADADLASARAALRIASGMTATDRSTP